MCGVAAPQARPNCISLKTNLASPPQPPLVFNSWAKLNYATSPGPSPVSGPHPCPSSSALSRIFHNLTLP